MGGRDVNKCLVRMTKVSRITCHLYRLAFGAALTCETALVDVAGTLRRASGSRRSTPDDPKPNFLAVYHNLA